jgi:hypothetical protein
MNMGVMIMTVRAHDAHNAMYRMIRPAPDGRRRAKDPGPAARYEAGHRLRRTGCSAGVDPVAAGCERPEVQVPLQPGIARNRDRYDRQVSPAAHPEH